MTIISILTLLFIICSISHLQMAYTNQTKGFVNLKDSKLVSKLNQHQAHNRQVIVNTN